jgi:GNAT superfamily N-acetyltransferase
VAAPAALSIRERAAGDDAWVAQTLSGAWGAPILVSRGRIHQGDSLPALIAEREGAPVGLLTYEIRGGEFEIVSLLALARRTGVGRALVDAAREAAARAGCRRVWLVTTNDNLPAIGFYQHVGLTLAAVHRGAAARARTLKPEIPEVGIGGIRIEDELEFEYVLHGSPTAPAGEPGAAARASDLPGPGGEMSEGPPRPRLLAAVLAALATGAAMLGLVQFALLPILVHSLSNAQVDWLRTAFTKHTGWLMAGVLVVSFLLSVPVFLVALWVGRSGRRSG